jgi:hypothetical protein
VFKITVMIKISIIVTLLGCDQIRAIGLIILIFIGIVALISTLPFSLILILLIIIVIILFILLIRIVFSQCAQALASIPGWACVIALRPLYLLRIVSAVLSTIVR